MDKPTQSVEATAQEVSVSAVIIRRDGTREDLGVISYWHRNPLKRLLHWFKTR